MFNSRRDAKLAENDIDSFLCVLASLREKIFSNTLRLIRKMSGSAPRNLTHDLRLTTYDCQLPTFIYIATGALMCG